MRINVLLVILGLALTSFSIMATNVPTLDEAASKAESKSSKTKIFGLYSTESDIAERGNGEDLKFAIDITPDAKQFSIPGAPNESVLGLLILYTDISVIPVGQFSKLDELQAHTVAHSWGIEPQSLILAGLGTLSYLKYLDLFRMKLPSIPGLENCRALEQLEISCNALEELPDLSLLPNLKYIDACNNKLRELKGLATLKGLEHLSIRENHISEVELPTTDTLKYLDISWNPILECPELKCFYSLCKFFVDTTQIDNLSFERQIRVYFWTRKFRVLDGPSNCSVKLVSLEEGSYLEGEICGMRYSHTLHKSYRGDCRLPHFESLGIEMFL